MREFAWDVRQFIADQYGKLRQGKQQPLPSMLG
jgi:hypothetical protein